MAEQRYRVDCGKMPSESGCTLVIEGPKEDLLDAAVEHAKSKHGHTDPDDVIRGQVAAALEPILTVEPNDEFVADELQHEPTGGVG